MRRRKCPGGRGRGRMPRTPHPARTVSWPGASSDKSFHPKRTPLLARDVLLAQNQCPAKTHLLAKEGTSVRQECSPSKDSPPGQEHPAAAVCSPCPRTTSITGRTLSRPRPSNQQDSPAFQETPCPGPSALSRPAPGHTLWQLSPLLRRPQALGTHQQPQGTHPWPPSRTRDPREVRLDSTPSQKAEAEGALCGEEDAEEAEEGEEDEDEDTSDDNYGERGEASAAA